MQSFNLTHYTEFAEKAKKYATAYNCCAILDSCAIMPALNKGFYKLIVAFGNTHLSIPENKKLEFLFYYWF